MRILLFTGKGGVGKSTVASGTAALAAAAGHRTLVLSTDAAHSLADAFGVAVGAEPVQVAPGLFVQQVDAQLRFEQSWAEIQGYLMSVLDVAIPLIGMLKRKGEKILIDAALKGLKKRVESLG